MARIALILGGSGTGKTRSIKPLPSKETFIVNPSEKELPWQGSAQTYPLVDAKHPPGIGRLYNTDRLSKAAKAFKHVSDKHPEIKYAIMDDNQYNALFTFIRRIDEKNFDKFNEIAVNMVEFIKFCRTLREDLTIFILNHIEAGTDARGNDVIQAKTMGKFVKEKVEYEGLFTTVLLCDKEEDDDDNLKHFFWTRMANATVKSPEGMFEDQKIPNDLLYVADRMRDYYNKQQFSKL